MSHLKLASEPHVRVPAGDPHDRALVRHMLTLTPTERLRNIAAYWPLIRVGLEQRALAGAPRP